MCKFQAMHVIQIKCFMQLYFYYLKAEEVLLNAREGRERGANDEE